MWLHGRRQLPRPSNICFCLVQWVNPTCKTPPSIFCTNLLSKYPYQICSCSQQEILTDSNVNATRSFYEDENQVQWLVQKTGRHHSRIKWDTLKSHGRKWPKGTTVLIYLTNQALHFKISSNFWGAWLGETDALWISLLWVPWDTTMVVLPLGKSMRETAELRGRWGLSEALEG